MNQFKDLFLGNEQRSYSRAVSIQKCIRAGGKHNDLDNVGRTKRHLTFFEMMGNFSFGDYFKRDAISYAWEFLTDVLGLPPEKLYVSVFYQDEESYGIWCEHINIPHERIVRLGADENFWQMGDTGPCGPCTEIHYDRGPQTPEEENAQVGDDTERFLEVWNLVFMQYDRDEHGTLHDLPNKGVDTGMGIERLCAILQDTPTVYETDIFMDIITAIERHCGLSYANASQEHQVAFRVLADHVRSTSLAIADGCVPSNDGRGYVIRKIIRRAALFAQKLKSVDIFVQLAHDFIAQMGDIYPDLTTRRELITSVIDNEVHKFAHNLEHGQAILEDYLKEHRADRHLPGQKMFRLYDTYGFPRELTLLIAHERGYTVDEDGFKQAMEEQRKRSAQDVPTYTTHDLPFHQEYTTEFSGYQETETTTYVQALATDSKEVSCLEAGAQGWCILAQSPIYTESGGQVSDKATLVWNNTTCTVEACRTIGTAQAVRITPHTRICCGDTVTAKVDASQRSHTACNHTATHLLQAALVEHLGDHVAQAGSLVTPEYLRFDFTHHQPLNDEVCRKIEDMVNARIYANIPVTTEHTTYKEAVNKGVRAIFGEKYDPDAVRAVHVGSYSSELCGGTHVAATGDIGIFKITEHTSPSTGIKRITAVTNTYALHLFQQLHVAAKQISATLKEPLETIGPAVEKQSSELKKTRQELAAYRSQALLERVPSLLKQKKDVAGIPYLAHEVSEATSNDVHRLAQALAERESGLYVVTAPASNGKHSFAIAAHPTTQSQLSLQQLATWLRSYGVKGGGKSGCIRGGYSIQDGTNLDQLVRSWLEGAEA